MSSWGDYKKQVEKERIQKEKKEESEKLLKERTEKVVEIDKNGNKTEREKTFAERFDPKKYWKIIKFGSLTGATLGAILGVDGLQKITIKKSSISNIAKATYKTAFYGSLSMCGFYAGMMLTKKVIADIRGSYDIINNISAITISLIPCIKVPLLKKYIMYPILLSAFDLFADYKNNFVI